MLEDLTTEQRALADFMSTLSEECYCAGWMTHLEYTLWEAVQGGPFPYGQSVISESNVGLLRDLSGRCGGWIYWDGTNEETFIGIKDWEQRYKEMTEMGSKYDGGKYVFAVTDEGEFVPFSESQGSVKNTLAGMCKQLSQAYDLIQSVGLEMDQLLGLPCDSAHASGMTISKSYRPKSLEESQ